MLTVALLNTFTGACLLPSSLDSILSLVLTPSKHRALTDLFVGVGVNLPPTCYTDLSSTPEPTMTMTLETANRIWEDCYQSTDLTLWGKYTLTQRMQAIETRDAHANGGWGRWNISDRD